MEYEKQIMQWTLKQMAKGSKIKVFNFLKYPSNQSG